MSITFIRPIVPFLMIDMSLIPSCVTPRVIDAVFVVAVRLRAAAAVDGAVVVMIDT